MSSLSSTQYCFKVLGLCMSDTAVEHLRKHKTCTLCLFTKSHVYLASFIYFRQHLNLHNIYKLLFSFLTIKNKIHCSIV